MNTIVSQSVSVVRVDFTAASWFSFFWVLIIIVRICRFLSSTECIRPFPLWFICGCGSSIHYSLLLYARIDAYQCSAYAFLLFSSGRTRIHRIGCIIIHEPYVTEASIYTIRFYSLALQSRANGSLILSSAWSCLICSSPSACPCPTTRT